MIGMDRRWIETDRYRSLPIRILLGCDRGYFLGNSYPGIFLNSPVWDFKNGEAVSLGRNPARTNLRTGAQILRTGAQNLRTGAQILRTGAHRCADLRTSRDLPPPQNTTRTGTSGRASLHTSLSLERHREREGVQCNTIYNDRQKQKKAKQDYYELRITTTATERGPRTLIQHSAATSETGGPPSSPTMVTSDIGELSTEFAGHQGREDHSPPWRRPRSPGAGPRTAPISSNSKGGAAKLRGDPAVQRQRR